LPRAAPQAQNRRYRRYPGEGAMKRPALFALALLTLSATLDAHAGSCASALTVRKVVPMQPLPRACAAMGPFRLGMTYAAMIATMGTPSAAASPSAGNREAVYVFPRNLEAELKRHPALQQDDVHFGYVEVMFHDDKVVDVSAFIPRGVAFPYSVGGIAIGSAIGSVQARSKAPLSWNTSRDHVWLGAYPIGIGVGPNRRINAIDIENKPIMNMRTYGPRFWWTTDPRNGLIRGYQVTLGPVCKPGLLPAC